MYSSQTKRSADWPVVCLLLVAIALTWIPLSLTILSRDYVEYLLPWYEHIRTEGISHAFARPFSNYAPAYLYLLAVVTLVPLPPLIAIKLLSSLGAIWTSAATYRLLKSVGAAKPVVGGIAALILPTLLINVPIYAQADTFWIAPCLLAIGSAYTRRTIALTFWAGVGFAFKAQAVFIAPFVSAVLWRNRAPFWQWLIPVAVYIAAILPAWLAGWPLSDLLTVYIRQAEWKPPNGVAFVSTASNWWAIYAYLDYNLASRSFWLGFAAVTVATTVYLRYFPRSENDMLIAACISAIMLPFLLPGMHERYFALAEVATFCVAWAHPSRSAGLAALLMQLQLLLAVYGWRIGHPESIMLGAVFVAAVPCLLLKRPLIVSAPSAQPTPINLLGHTAPQHTTYILE